MIEIKGENNEMFNLFKVKAMQLFIKKSLEINIEAEKQNNKIKILADELDCIKQKFDTLKNEYNRLKLRIEEEV
jgi:hypothetical protein